MTFTSLKKIGLLTGLVTAALFSGSSTAQAQSHKKADYVFDNKISRPVLENYLERAMTFQSLLVGKGNFEDNLRMIKKYWRKIYWPSRLSMGPGSRHHG